MPRWRSLLGQRRLVTLTGVGGAGKTRLALEAAERSLPDFPEGVISSTLGPRRSRARRPRGRRRLNVREQADERDRGRLAAHLRDADLLLVLDNCEHVREACGELARRPPRRLPARQDPGDEPRGARRPRRGRLRGAAARASRGGGNRRSCAPRRPSGSSSPGPARRGRASKTTTGRSQARPGSAATSTACRSRSSSPPRGRRRCRSKRSRAGSPIASASSSRGGG